MPIVADVEPISRLLGNLVPGEPLAHGALTAIPLMGPLLAEPGWLTLAEAGERARITEVSEEGRIPELRVTNAADQPLLLLDGEELVGARQNRVLNTTVLVGAHSELTVPVSCVEQGRWSYRDRQFSGGDASLYASIRRRKSEDVGRSIRAGQGHVSDQGAIWSELAARTREHQVASPTGAMRDFYAQHQAEMAAARAALAPGTGQVGVLVYLSGRWVGGDVLASPGLFARAWERLCPGYAADALGARAAAHLKPRPPALLRRLETCPVEPVRGVGLGTEYRLTGLRTTGAALVSDDRVAHLMMFPAAP
jgi:hypothetical protein